MGDSQAPLIDSAKFQADVIAAAKQTSPGSSPHQTDPNRSADGRLRDGHQLNSK